MADAPRRAFQTLDGLRGVGAFIIVMRHVPGFFGPLRVPESFLAVDLFYLVSGFVVAHAYGERLAAGGFGWDFVKTRIIRLYPLYLIGLLVGLLAAVVSLATDPHSSWTPVKIVVAVATGLLMIPRFPGLSVNGSTLNGPIWTLLYELVANFAYAAAIRVLRTWVLVGIMIVCGLGLIYAELRFHTLDVGYNITDQWCGLARVGFSFFAGVLIYRLSGTAQHTSNAIAWACLLVVGIMLGLHLPKPMLAAYEIGAILVGLPLLLIIAARFEPTALSGRLFAFVGLVSYAVYLLHQPLGNMAYTQINRVVRIPHSLAGALIGVVFLGLLVAMSWWLDVYYDGPVRRVLRGWLLPSKPAPAKSGAAAPS